MNLEKEILELKKRLKKLEKRFEKFRNIEREIDNSRNRDLVKHPETGAYFTR